MKKEHKFLIFLILLALIVRIIFVFVEPIQIWDGTVFANLGHDLSSNPFSYNFNNGYWSDYVPLGEWPKAGFRPPVLPYTLAIWYLLGLGNLVKFFMCIIGALSVWGVFLLSKKIFNKEVAIYSSVFLALLPLHVVYSAKLLSSLYATFFLLFAILFFWKGFEENKDKYKILFGVFLALSLLTRYTVLWLFLIFPIYLLIKNKNFSFLKDKYLWYSILSFFVILIPWLCFGKSTYENFLGAFMHGIRAASTGHAESVFFYVVNSYMFSILALVVILCVFLFFYKKQFRSKEVLFLFLWIFLFFIISSIYHYKEIRFLLPISPAICILSGFFVSQLKTKKLRKTIFSIIILFLVTSLILQFGFTYHKENNPTNLCFIEANKFLKNLEENSVVMTDESPRVYYYSKKETHFYPRPMGLEGLNNLVNNYYEEKEVYILFTDFDMPLNNEINIQIKQDLDDNFEKSFECSEDTGFSAIYKYN
ncbi:glycosyltransferase family 39 protein [Candidatus Pacearchaeota archaeon]|nr:glycosyltransferase family 39 protein [Candidatus Pacearchaeota archaeon]